MRRRKKPRSKMARITLDQIVQELSEDNWVVLSKEYVNLSSQMEFQCPEGHIIYTSWDKLRRKHECPVCKQNKLKNITNEIIPKKKGCQRIMALDQASHISGISIFDGKDLVYYGTFETNATDEYGRLHEVNNWLISLINTWRPDVIGIEGIQFQQYAGVTTFQTLARLQGILIETCMQNNINFKVCPTNTWRSHCGVKGRSRVDKKRSMQALVKSWYDIQVNEDCADAIGIGKYLVDIQPPEVEIECWV